MPEFRIPTTPEEWAAIEPNGTDLLVGMASAESDERDDGCRVDRGAAAARLLERERVTNEHVERLAVELMRRDYPPDTLAYYTKLDTRREEARRILEG